MCRRAYLEAEGNIKLGRRAVEGGMGIMGDWPKQMEVR